LLADLALDVAPKAAYGALRWLTSVSIGPGLQQRQIMQGRGK